MKVLLRVLRGYEQAASCCSSGSFLIPLGSWNLLILFHCKQSFVFNILHLWHHNIYSSAHWGGHGLLLFIMSATFSSSQCRLPKIWITSSINDENIIHFLFFPPVCHWGLQLSKDVCIPCKFRSQSADISLTYITRFKRVFNEERMEPELESCCWLDLQHPDLSDDVLLWGC